MQSDLHFNLSSGTSSILQALAPTEREARMITHMLLYNGQFHAAGIPALDLLGARDIIVLAIDLDRPPAGEAAVIHSMGWVPDFKVTSQAFLVIALHALQPGFRSVPTRLPASGQFVSGTP